MISDIIPATVIHSPPPSQSFLGKRTSLWITLLVAVLATLFLSAAIVLGVLYGIERNKAQNNQGSSSNDYCLTSYCVKAADDLLDSIDTTVDPCENFYQFACGTWIANTEIPDGANNQDYTEILTNNLDTAIVGLLSTSPSDGTTELNAIVNTRLLYNSCLQQDTNSTDTVDTVSSFIDNELGGWPLLQNSSWSNSAFNFTQLLIKQNVYNSYALFATSTQPEDMNSTVQNIQIGQGDLGLGASSYYLTDSNSTAVYIQYMQDMAQALNNGASVNDTDITAIFEFEKAIALIYMMQNTQNPQGGASIYTTVGNLTAIINTTFNFADYLRGLYFTANVTLVDTDMVTITELESLQNVSLLINETPLRTVQNYMVWRSIMALAKYMPQQLRTIQETFDEAFQGISPDELTVTCADYVNDLMGFAVSKLYVDEYFDPDSRNQSLDMIGYIRAAFIDAINQEPWMDSPSKIAAVKKAQVMTINVGYPDYFNDSNGTQLDNMYAEYDFTSSSSFLENILLIQKVVANTNLQSLRQPIDRTVWSMTPTTVDALYVTSVNSITIPAAILQTPYFNKNVPKYLNYGGIGAVMGHEITHGFDNSGGEYDENGNKITWLSNATITAFNILIQCFVQQYDNYTLEQIDEPILGDATLTENIADNGGIKNAFYGYQKWKQANSNVDQKLPGLDNYTAEQLFFISYGYGWCSKMSDQYALNYILTDEHAPSEFRVIGPTSNFVEFDRAFGCTPGQGNSRVNKCTVW